MKKGTILFGILAMLFVFTACGANENVPTISATENKMDLSAGSTLVAEQTLTGTEGDIHYSYYLPKDFDESKKSPMMVVMPGYDMMWFGEDSSGSNV